jgi:salicylate hydroxylase
LENADLRAYSQWDHEVDAPTYAKNRVCMIGDAAHAMTPWQGSGAGQAMEDVMVLEALLKEVQKPAHLSAAFKAYDKVRRPRTQQIVASSRGTGHIMCGRGINIGLDPDKIMEALVPRWGFIYGIDLKEHKKEAVEAFLALL